MYKPITKDEFIVISFMLLSATLYRVFDDFTKIHFSGKFVIIIFMILSGYLLFNRQVKMIINLIIKRKLYYPVTAVITEIKNQSVNYGVVKGKYPVFVITYHNENNKISVKELHNFFSIKSIKKGQKVKLMINRNNLDDIIVVSSDVFLFIIYCIMGIIFESISLILLLNIH